jgi:hypothetical protein
MCADVMWALRATPYITAAKDITAAKAITGRTVIVMDCIGI